MDPGGFVDLLVLIIGLVKMGFADIVEECGDDQRLFRIFRDDAPADPEPADHPELRMLDHLHPAGQRLVYV